MTYYLRIIFPQKSKTNKQIQWQNLHIIKTKQKKISHDGVPRIIKYFVGALSGIALFNSTWAPHMFIIFLMVSPPEKNK